MTLKVNLICPNCLNAKFVDRDPSDPPNTRRVVCTCPSCYGSGDFDNVTYFDMDGDEIDLDGLKIAPPVRDLSTEDERRQKDGGHRDHSDR